MRGSEETKPHELVIIRRRAGEEEGGHHGGVWKIAYADFMTAMMAFFLVMWLINSTDKKTLTQVATYFNPLRLTDKTPSARGLQQSRGRRAGQDPLRGATKSSRARQVGKTTTQGKGEVSKPTFAEEAMFRDPHGQPSHGSRAGRAGPEARRSPGIVPAASPPGTPASRPSAPFAQPEKPQQRRGPTPRGAADRLQPPSVPVGSRCRPWPAPPRRLPPGSNRRKGSKGGADKEGG